MKRCNKKEKEYLLGIEPKYLLQQPFDVASNIDYLSIRTEVNNTLKIKGSHISSKDLWYSFDKVFWTKLNTTTTTEIPMNAGDIVYLKGNNNTFNDESHKLTIDATQDFYCDGNIMSLVNWKEEVYEIPSSYFFASLFISSKIKKAPNLPATTLTDYCYSAMFYNTARLSEAPELSATNIAVGCYKQMFSRSRITKAPSILPATTLYESCYEDMFSYNYDWLVTGVSEISGTNSAPKCFMNMFTDCEKIDTPIVIKSTTMSTDSHVNMFYGAKKINNVTVYVNTWDTNKATRWLETVASSGDLYNLGGATIPTGSNGCPSNWRLKVPVSITASITKGIGTIEIPQDIYSYDNVEIVFRPDASNDVLSSLKDNNADANTSNIEFVTEYSNPVYKYTITNIQENHSLILQFDSHSNYQNGVTKTITIGGGVTSTTVYASDYVSVSHNGSVSANFNITDLNDNITIQNVTCRAKISGSSICSGNPLTGKSTYLNNMGSSVSWSGGVTNLNCGSSWTTSMFDNLKIYAVARASEPNICTENQGSVQLYGAELNITYNYTGTLYTITSQKTGSGSVSSDIKFLQSGYSYLYSAQPDEGYHISSVTLDGNAIILSEDGTYLLSNITTDHAFEVTFEQNS